MIVWVTSSWLESELPAAQMDRLAEGGFPPGPIYTDLPLAARGELTLSPHGVHSQAVGSLAFMTPIAEMPVDKVTKAEADACADIGFTHAQGFLFGGPRPLTDDI